MTDPDPKDYAALSDTNNSSELFVSLEQLATNSLMTAWKRAIATNLYADLTTTYHDILTLLADGEISVGKACEAIAERSIGKEPALPTPSLPSRATLENLSWRDLYNELKLERDALRRLRLVTYEPWVWVWVCDGGHNECAHGLALGIPCLRCDVTLVEAALAKEPK